MGVIKDTKNLMKQIQLNGSDLSIAETLEQYKTEVYFIEKCMICGEQMRPEDSFGELGYVTSKSYKFLKLCPACFSSVHSFLVTRRKKAKEKVKFLRRIHRTYP